MRPGKRALSNCRWFQFPKVSGAGEGLSKKWGGPRLGSGAGVVFTPAPGVIHPCFPLRGRWERNTPTEADNARLRATLRTGEELPKLFFMLWLG